MRFIIVHGKYHDFNSNPSHDPCNGMASLSTLHWHSCYPHPFFATMRSLSNTPSRITLYTQNKILQRERTCSNKSRNGGDSNQLTAHIIAVGAPSVPAYHTQRMPGTTYRIRLRPQANYRSVRHDFRLRSRNTLPCLSFRQRQASIAARTSTLIFCANMILLIGIQ